MTRIAHILVVEDESNIRSALVTMLEKLGHKVQGAGTAEESLALLEHTKADLVITDLRMPGLGGMEFLHRMKENAPETEAIVMTAFGSIDTAVEAMRPGAYDYLTKPIDRDRFHIVVEKALERRALAQENKQLRERLETQTRFDQLAGESEPMQRVYSLVDMVADSAVTVLLTGESGTGKELVARAIHHRSARAGGPFVTMNCGALPENLFESELFGYEKGAFTGAMTTKAGRFELADGGTLLLDEGENELTYALREELEKTRDYAKALHSYPDTLNFAKAMLNRLLQDPTDFVGAFKELPKNLLMMFVNAYESLMFNKILSERIKKNLPIHQAIVGDIIYPMRKQIIANEPIPVTAANLEKVNLQITKKKAVVTGLLVGYESRYAEGEMGTIEHAIIDAQKIDPRDFIIQEIPFLSSAGSRRPLLALFPSLDWTLQNDELHPDHQSLNLHFDLQKGCYATSLLREIMKTTDPKNY